MGWRLHLQADPYTTKLLEKQYRGQTQLMLGHEADGTLYASGTRFADCQNAQTALAEARKVASELTAMARVLDPSASAVVSMDRVRDDTRADGFATVFSQRSIRWRTGVEPASQPPSSVGDISRLADRDPDYAAALALFGKPGEPDAVLLYKVFEFLKRSAGGSEKAFLQRSGWSKQELRTLTGSLNHPDVLGAGARHAVLPGGTPRHSWTLAQCAQRLAELIRRWPSESAT
ncbi:hypothetical protein LL946_10815 [Knoellia locipacati]|uniref:hypothetical protein n=1 Tax=Knoellia locipacati TaxID=882824 RepID=UPI00384EF3E4